MSNTRSASDSVLSDAEVAGGRGKVLTMTYRPDGVQLWRKKELFYDVGGRPWKLIVDWAITSAEDTGGDALFDGAMNTFRAG